MTPNVSTKMSNSRVEEIREYDMEKPNLTHVQSVGGMTISPELFEKVGTPFG